MINGWMDDNNLSLDDNKDAEVHFFTTRREPYPKQSERMLGITLDSRLTWLPHIEELGRRLSGALYAVRRVTNSINREAGRTTYFALFHSIMTYGLLLWGASAHTKRIFTLQKRAVRVLETATPTTHARPFFKKYNIMTVYSAYIYLNVLMVKNEHHERQKDVHDHDTRGREC